MQNLFDWLYIYIIMCMYVKDRQFMKKLEKYYDIAIYLKTQGISTLKCNTIYRVQRKTHQ